MDFTFLVEKSTSNIGLISKLTLNERYDGALNQNPLSLERHKNRSICNEDKK